jgi:RNA polymerase sigma factor (sigma-70 family)
MTRRTRPVALPMELRKRRNALSPPISRAANTGGAAVVLTFRWKRSWGSRAPRTGESLVSNRPGPVEHGESAERQRAVRQAVDALPDDLREAIALCEWEEMSVADAAAVLGTTKKGVESRLYRARQKLRERLRKLLT